MKIKNIYWLIRRKLLKRLVPEIVWPRRINVDGADIAIRHAPYSFGTKRLLLSGKYELEERNLLNKYLKYDDQVIEMGGSIGILTAVIGEVLGQNGKIVSIEASKKLSDHTRKWLPSDNIYIVHGFGFPVMMLPQDFKISHFDESGGSLGGKVKWSVNSDVNNEENSIIYDFRRIIHEFNVSPTFAVIDIEGSERIIETFGFSCPKSVNYILIELHPSMYGLQSMNIIIDKIESEGFVVTENISNVYLFTKEDSLI